MKHTALKISLLLNHIFFILHLCGLVSGEAPRSIEGVAPLFISSLILIDAAYISACNIKGSKVISLFCGLLVFTGWYVLLAFEQNPVSKTAFTALSPIIWYVSVKFILMLLFQGGGYAFRKSTNFMLLAACIGALTGICISDQAFALLYGLQCIVNTLCFLLVIGYHWERVVFVLKSERKCILLSLAVTTISFFVYYLATIGVQNHLANFGIYLPVLLFFISVHGIVLKEHSGTPLSTVFSKKQIAAIIGAMLIIFAGITSVIGGGYATLLLCINVLLVLVYICNIALEYTLKQGKSRMIKESKYYNALQQLQQKEALKTEFANFLHDDVLQDLLSVKNMMTKANRPDIHDMIIETLDGLNTHIRNQMQDYRPAILKNLTAKENYQNVLEGIAQAFPQKQVAVSFACSDNLFLVEPYNVLIYRLTKELLTNIYKHSDGSRAWVTLTQQSGMIQLSVSDDGNAHAACLTSADAAQHKGISSIFEQVRSLGGAMTIANNTPHGICVQITIPMRGEDSYQYFVSG